MSCGIGCRHCWDLVLLWHRLAAVALIRPLAWEPPHAAGAALEKAERQKKKNKKQNKTKQKNWSSRHGTVVNESD